LKLRLSTSLGIAATVVLSRLSLADISLPATVTVYFKLEGKPYFKPVDFKVRCYGWARHPGQPGWDMDGGKRPEPYTPEEVYDLSGNCPSYGCKIHHSLYLNYKHIDYCDLEGNSEGRSFRIQNFGTSPVGECSDDAGSGKGWFEHSCELKFAIPK
jgi:hypothetical protein